MPRPSRQVIYQRLDRAVEDLYQTTNGLPTVEEAKGIWENIWQEEAHHSTAMEGNTLVAKEVQLLLFERKAAGGKSLREYLEVEGYADAALWVYGQAVRQNVAATDLSVLEIHEIHKRVVEPVWRYFPPEHLDRRDRPGSFRHTNVEPLRPGLVPPEWPDVPPQIRDWVGEANAIPEGTQASHAIEDFARLHASFERIHPFGDGNGRTGRLVLNLLLVRYGYPPAVIHKRDRSRYLDGLKRADEGDPGLLGEVLARAVKHGIDRFLMPGLTGPHRYVPLTALTDTGFSHNALLLAAKRGRLEAAYQNGQWYSSRKCIEAYRDSLYQRRKRVA